MATTTTTTSTSHVTYFERPSIVEWFGDHQGYKCGYCRSPDTNYSHGMWAHCLKPIDYQDLVLRGWRRGGKYVYKPIMNTTCCPQYPILCDVREFKLNRSHKKIIKKFNRYLMYGDTHTDGGFKCLKSPSSSDSEVVYPVMDDISAAKPSPKPGDGPDPDKPICIKAKEKRLLNKMAKMSSQGANSSSTTNFKYFFKRKAPEQKKLEDLLNEADHARSLKHSLEVKLVRTSPITRDYILMEDESYKIYKDYQIKIHGDSPSDVTERAYRQFLVDSPIESETIEDSDDSVPGCGSYHCHYFIDNKLIAVGVMDILPSFVSSVYLFYDPEYKFLSLGTYTALWEIAYVRRLLESRPELVYYNLGFYIHSCPKMRYKGQFSPSYLVCPETYTLVPAAHCFPLLDVHPYSRLCSDETKVDEDQYAEDVDIGLLFKQQAINLQQYKEDNPSEQSLQEIQLYSSLVGRKCSRNMLLFRKK